MLKVIILGADTSAKEAFVIKAIQVQVNDQQGTVTTSLELDPVTQVEWDSVAATPTWVRSYR